jgi:hypothetical protein
VDKNGPLPDPAPGIKSKGAFGSGLDRSQIKGMAASRLATKSTWQRAMAGERRVGQTPAHSLY